MVNAGERTKPRSGAVIPLQLRAPAAFDLEATCRSHGWIALAPVRWETETRTLWRVDQLPGDRVVQVQIQQLAPEHVLVYVKSEAPLADAERETVAERVRWMLRMDEDLMEFYELIAQQPRWSGVVKSGMGRLLRSPDLFEDVVKTICTTNTRWVQTKNMVRKLVDNFGEPFPLEPELRAFPRPEALAAAEPAELQAIGLGYRAPYIAELAQRVASGELDLEAWKEADENVDTLRRKLSSLKGIGPYGTATLLMLLGIYDYLAIDSEMRAFVAQHYLDDADVTDTAIRQIYEPWGKWKYLAYWLDPGSNPEM